MSYFTNFQDTLFSTAELSKGEKEKIDNSIEFACSLPWAFRRKLMRDYYCIADVRPIIKENEVFKTALRNNWQ